MSGRLFCLMLACALALASIRVRAQELEPRAYSANPIGTNFMMVGYAHSEGGVLFDASLPLSDVTATLDAVSPAYGGTIPVVGRAGSFAIAVPYVWGEASGNVGENSRSASREGFGDLRLRFSLPLMGGEALTPAQFMKRQPSTLIGASIVIVAPTGKYDPSKLVNLGSNRWSFKPEIGWSKPLGHWLVEVSVGAWLFTDNDDFFGGRRREQDVLGSMQLHVSYMFRPRLWVAVDSTYYCGGETRVDGIANRDRQGNSRLGITLSAPLGRAQSIKLAWATGVSTRFGGDFDTYGIFWQYAWFTPR